MRRRSAPWTTAPVSRVRMPRDMTDRRAPRDCETMSEVRQGVDAIDRMLVELLAERQGYMDAAARIKTDRGVVRDPARIEEVVARVKTAAREAGLSEAIAEPVWRTLIDRCIAYEFGVWDKLRDE